MKTKPTMDPAAAFPDSAHPPVDAEFDRIAAPLAAFRTAHPEVTTAWQFSNQSGWYQLHLRRKRRLLYLIPKRDDARVMMILGGKALDDLKRGPFARQTNALLKTAMRYPEGTAFSFTAKTVDPGLLGAFLAAKLAH